MGVVHFFRFLFHSNLVLCILLLCCSSSSSSEAYSVTNEGEDKTRRSDGYHVIKGSSLLSEPLVCSTTTSSTPSSMQGDPSDASSLKVVHRQHHCSKSHQLNQHEETTKSTDQTLDHFFLQDQIRVNSIQSRLSRNKNINSVEIQRKKESKASIPANSGLPLGIGNYFVTVGFGTPKTDLSVIFDTGSDFTWIQCKPCAVFCHEQEEPIFDPLQSKTYSNITCNTTACAQVRSATSTTPRCSSSSTCIYGIQYGDQSYSVGYFASEKLTLTPTDAFPNFLFGCGQNNRGLFGRSAGLLGLGRDKLSLISQTAKKYGKVFSYCLPATLNSTGYLKLGNEKRYMKSKSIKFTPLLTDSRGPSFYFLDLVGISVGGTQLSIPSTVFASSGTIIDSGTVISRLPPSAYSVLRSNFRSSMSEYPLTQPTRLFDTCYNISSYDTVSVPKIALYFRGGAELDVTLSGILVGRIDQLCLAFAGNQDDKDVAIIGNRQQQTFKVQYDVTRKKLGFIPGGCS